MEWEVMFLCNTVGFMLIFMISLFHLIGVDKEKNSALLMAKNE